MTATATCAPIERELVVRCPVGRAFEVFTDRIGEWWPLATHSIAAESGRVAVEVTLEGRAGGRLYETQADGTECAWGTVITWDPPRRLMIEWRVNPARPPTEIDVRFAPHTDGTLVTLVHAGWDDAGHRDGYHRNWDGVLARFGSLASS